MTDTLTELLAGIPTENLGELSMETLRAHRTACQEAEVSLSYVRRLVQGRLDIAAAILAARVAGTDIDTGILVERLPQILSDESRKFSPIARPENMSSYEDTNDTYSKPLTDELEQIVSADSLASSSDTSEPKAREMVESLEALERRVSDLRHRTHECLDQLQAEVVRRYKSGEATVDALLAE